MLVLSDVWGSYHQKPVVENVSMTVRAGEICTVLGANGAGKSTLLRAIMGLLPRIGGSIKGPGGVELNGRPTYAIARCGVTFVPEGRGILFGLTVKENLLLGATPARLRSDQRISSSLDAMLDRFPILRERLDQHAGLLSGGQQQMLAIARALVSEPQVLLLDEPSLGLAPKIRTEIAEVLTAVKRSGLAIVLVEQDVQVAAACSDYAYVLRSGQITMPLSVAEMADRNRLRDLYFGTARERHPTSLSEESLIERVRRMRAVGMVEGA